MTAKGMWRTARGGGGSALPTMGPQGDETELGNQPGNNLKTI